MLGLKEITGVAQSEFVFAILFIGLLWLAIRQVKQTLDESRQSSLEREKYIFDIHERQMTELKENMLHERNSSHELMIEQRVSFDQRETALLKHLEKNTDQLGNIADTLKDVQKNLKGLEKDVNDNFLEVWKELGSKADKQNKRSED